MAILARARFIAQVRCVTTVGGWRFKRLVAWIDSEQGKTYGISIDHKMFERLAMDQRKDPTDCRRPDSENARRVIRFLAGKHIHIHLTIEGHDGRAYEWTPVMTGVC